MSFNDTKFVRNMLKMIKIIIRINKKRNRKYQLERKYTMLGREEYE